MFPLFSVEAVGSVFFIVTEWSKAAVCLAFSSEAAGCGERGGAGGSPSTPEDPSSPLLYPPEAGHLCGARGNAGHPPTD